LLLDSGYRWNTIGCGIARYVSYSVRVVIKLTEKLGSSSLYPQSPLHPRRSDNGKHVVKLLLNGAWRGVIIDSLLPYSKSTSKPLHATTQPISSTSTAIGPPWIPLATKGYYKALGGYTIRGSDPGPDIYAFTGWIPERLSMKGGFQREKEWRRVYDSWRRGKLLVTLGTGEVVQRELVPFHAYGVIGLREENGERRLEIVDPGSTPRQSDGVLEESMNRLSPKPNEGKWSI
jgi:calpain-7